MVGFIAGIGAVSLVFASPAFILALKGRFCGLRSPLRSFLWHPQYCWPDPLPSRPKSTIAPASRSLRPGAERTVWLDHTGFLRTRRPVSPPSTIARALQARRAWRRSDARNGRDTR